MPNIVAQLAITLDDAGNVAVNGPIENRILVFGMMELAKDACNKLAESNKKLITTLPPGTHLRPV